MVARGRSKNAPTGLIVVLKFVCRGGVSPPDFLGPPRTSTPTDLIVFLKFACRGGYYPPVYNNPSVIFLRKCHLPLHKGGAFVVLTLQFGVVFCCRAVACCRRL